MHFFLSTPELMSQYFLRSLIHKTSVDYRVQIYVFSGLNLFSNLNKQDLFLFGFLVLFFKFLLLSLSA